jgi:hypothetical protein
LESMIEFTLISSILNRIYEMKKKALGYWKNDTKLDPFRHLVEFITWGTKWKRVIEKIDEWAAWWWANANIDPKNLALLNK